MTMYEIAVEARNEAGAWERIDLPEPGTRRDFELVDVSARDIGDDTNIGEELRVVLLDPDSDREIAERFITAKD